MKFETERLQQAFHTLLKGQDQDTVNAHFTSAMCMAGEYAVVNMEKGTINVHDSDTGEETKFFRFETTISLVETDFQCEKEQEND